MISAAGPTAQQKQLLFIAHTFEANQPQLLQPAAMRSYEGFARTVVAGASQPVPQWKLAMLAAKLAAWFHDQHAYIAAPETGQALPVGFYWASDGLVVVPLAHAPKAIESGSSVVRIRTLTVADIERRIESLLPGNSYLRRYTAGNDLVSAEFLRMLGVVSPDGMVTVELRSPAGRKYRVHVGLESARLVENATSVRLATNFNRRYIWLGGMHPSKRQVFLWRIFPHRNYAVFWLLQCSPSQRLDQAIKQFFTATEADRIGNVVLDVDFDPGGMGTTVNAFLPYLPQPSPEGYYTMNTSGDAQDIELHRPASLAPFRGKVYVVTNWASCSAAVIFADVLATNGLATTVGQPTGGNPQPTANPQNFPVPHSDLVVTSANYMTLLPNMDQEDASSLRPEINVPVTVEDVQEGIDPLTRWLNTLATSVQPTQ